MVALPIPIFLQAFVPAQRRCAGRRFSPVLSEWRKSARSGAGFLVRGRASPSLNLRHARSQGTPLDKITDTASPANPDLHPSMNAK
jgi:hypothetical protein